MGEHKIKKVFVEGAISPSFIADAIAKHAVKQEIGAHSIFLGQVRRDEKEGRHVKLIRYTAYEEMANPVFQEIREAAFATYDLTCMHIYHSLGDVPAGEISLFVFTSAPHRRAALDACNEIVERIKKEAAVWGEEIFDDDTAVWKVNTP